jgi:hypothetical protein
VRLSPLGTSATGGLLYQPRMIDDDDYEAVGGMRIDRGYRSTRRKPAPVPLCPPQIPHDLTLDRTRAAAVGSQRLAALAMARPSQPVSEMASVQQKTQCVLWYAEFRSIVNVSPQWKNVPTIQIPLQRDVTIVQQRSTRIKFTPFDYRQQSYRAFSSGFSLYSWVFRCWRQVHRRKKTNSICSRSSEEK